MNECTQSRWADWLLSRWFGGSPEQRLATLTHLYAVRDRILKLAAVSPGDSLLDVGCGTGLIGFGALELEHVNVIFCDICQDVLEHAKQVASQAGNSERCAFLEASADRLGRVEDGSLDVVVLRSVLIYVRPKRRAIQEFYRVLRPGGRLVLCEPLNNYWGPQSDARFRDYDLTPISELAKRITQYYAGAQPENDPMLDFDEHTLLDYAESAGFKKLTLELAAEIDVAPRFPSWDVYLDIAPNPNAPTLREAINSALSAEEALMFTEHLRPAVEQQRGIRRSAICYLRATK